MTVVFESTFEGPNGYHQFEITTTNKGGFMLMHWPNAGEKFVRTAELWKVTDTIAEALDEMKRIIVAEIPEKE